MKNKSFTAPRKTQLTVLLETDTDSLSAKRYRSSACYQEGFAQEAARLAGQMVDSNARIEVVSRTGELSAEMLIACGEIVAALYNAELELEEEEQEQNQLSLPL